MTKFYLNMKFNYFSKEKLFLLWVLVLVAQLGFTQNVSNFQPSNYTYKDNGTVLYNGITIERGLEKPFLSANNTDEIQLVFTFDNFDKAQAGQKLMQSLGGEMIGPKFEVLPIQGITATPQEALAMAEQVEGVIGIWENTKLESELFNAVVVSSVKDAWEDSEFTTLNDGIAISGSGVGVLINDTGFDGMDSDIQTSAESDFSIRLVQNVKGLQAAWQEDFGDDNDQGAGHGSHCMGIVGGDGRHSNGKVVGVAPGATLLGYGSGAVLLILDVIGAYDYIAKHRKDYNIRVMSNSYGTGSDTMFTSFDAANATSIATKALADAGVMVVFSAGNSGGNGDGTITGNYKTAPWVLCVGNGQKDGILAGSSSRGRKDPAGVHPAMRATITSDGVDYLWENRPTITAPGTDIIASKASLGATGAQPALNEAGLTPEESIYYTSLSGTSMACPHIAGIVALMIEANPDLEWRAIKAIIQRTAITSMSEQFHQRGAGYVNAWAAVAAAFNGLCDAPEGATYEEKYGLPSDGSFGFDTDPWKTCPLNDEVAERLKSKTPLPDGVEPLCDFAAPTIVDDPADSGNTFLDIEEVRFENETASDFQVALKVANDLALAPPSTSGTGFQTYFDVHFTLSRGDGNTPDVTYILSAFDDVANGKVYKLKIRSADGTTRPHSNGLNEDLQGTWNETLNTITFTVPKAQLDATGTPADGDQATPRGAAPPRKGDRLRKWEAYIYERPLTITPDGPGVYDDQAAGTCYKFLDVQIEQ